MSRAKITFAYDGTAYHGWQYQTNAVTVQEKMQDALSTLFKEPITVVGCSRTDAGVHAKNFVAHFDMPHPFPLEKLPLALNALLPGDIAVKEAVPVPDTFHARFSCLGKTYCYQLWNARLRDPFQWNRSYFYPVPLDEKKMNLAAQEFVGTHDFCAFMATGSEMEDTVRRIESFSVEREGDLLRFTVTGNGFLYNMVRIMVGTLIYFDLGKLDRGISGIIQSQDRTLAGITVPPQGLSLEKVYY